MSVITTAATLALLSGAVLSGAVLSGVASPAIAGPAIGTFLPETVTDEPDYTYGFAFLFHDPETIRGLGAYNSGNNGLSGSAQVGLWDANGTLLASTTIPAGTAATLIGNFSYNGITPITLSALTPYYVGSYQPFDPVSSFQTANSSSALGANIIAVAQQYGVGPGLVFPDLPDADHGTAGAYLGANFTDGVVPISGVPEPATLIVLAAGLAGIAMFPRRTLRA